MMAAGKMASTLTPRTLLLAAGLLVCLLIAFPVSAHDLSEANARYVSGLSGSAPGPFMYLGAKHMVTGLDHVLFLVGVIFFLTRIKDVALYVSLFTLGHSITLLTGVLANVSANAHLVDALIGVSVIYKGFDNLDGFQRVWGFRPDLKLVVFGFGLVHGFGLATKLQALSPASEGLVGNIISFNIGVEIGQFIALAVMVILLDTWRRHSSFQRFSNTFNTCLMGAGVALTAAHLLNFFQGGHA